MDGLYIIGLNDQNIEFDPDQLLSSSFGLARLVSIPIVNCCFTQYMYD